MLLATRICWLIILGGFVVYEILRFLFTVVPVFTTIVIGATFFSYLIHPFVAWLHRKLPIALSVILVYAALALAFAFILYIVSPIVAQDAQSVARDAPALVATGQRILTDPRDPLTAHLPPSVHRYLLSIPPRIERDLGNYAVSLASQFLPVLLSVVSVLALFIVIPAVAGYMTAESKSVKRSLLGYLPRRVRLRGGRIMQDLDRVVGGFIRGQLLVAAIVGILVTVLLLGLHVRYAVLIGVSAGALDVIPYVGAIAGWLPAFVVAYMYNGIENALAVSLGMIVINQIEGHLIVPNIVSRTVALTPLGVILALIVGGEVLGLPGLLIAVPAAGVVRVLFINFAAPSQHRRRREPTTPGAVAVLFARLVARSPSAGSRAPRGSAEPHHSRPPER